ncbi:MAG: GNAT family N-acetyltransferase [Chryseobacterium sp.]|nr:GNAT family N-acetyltransferase [Chryseobacterium sp.]
MEFVLISDFSDFRVKSIFKAYCDTFPEAERRSKAQFENLFEQETVKIFSILNDADFIGYFIIWELDGFVFLEHFEIFQSFRNKNLGSGVLKKLVQTYPNVILETETEKLNAEAPKRIIFYQNNGFHKILDSYVQPSYGEGKESLQLLLFANFQPENLEMITENIYDVVYGK